MKEKCLVAGGKGFIGSHLVNFLKKKGYWVRNVDTATESYLETNEDEFLQLDLRKLESCVEAVEGVDWVFQLGANMGGIGYITELNAEIMRDNVSINMNMLEAVRNGFEVDRIFFSSSACVYPRFLQTTPDVKGLKETDVIPAHPDSAYGWEKLFSEILYKSYEHDFAVNVRIARFHNIYGSFGTYKGGQEKAPAALCRKVAEAKDGGSIVVWGDGEQTRSYTYIADCLEGVYRLMKSDFNEPVNIGTDDLISVDDLALLVMDIAGKKLSITHDLSKPQGVRGRNADLTLVKKVLDWKPKVSLKEGMTVLYKWIANMLERKE